MNYNTNISESIKVKSTGVTQKKELTSAQIIGILNNRVPKSIREQMEKAVEQSTLIETIGAVVTTDPKESALKVPFYRNIKHKVFAMYTNLPEDIKLIQAVSVFLLENIPGVYITEQDYLTQFVRGDARFDIPAGNTKVLRRTIDELIFLLRLKKDIDYESSEIRSMSILTSWLIKEVMLRQRDNPNCVLSVKDHMALEKIIGCDSETVAYKCFTQLMSVMVMIASLKAGDTLSLRLRKIVLNEDQNIKIVRYIKDIKGIEPLYIYNSVISPEEKSLIIKEFGKDPFKLQAELLVQFKRKPTKDNEALALSVQDNLWKKIKFRSTIYGRMKFYHSLKSDNAITSFLQKEKRNQLYYREVLQHAKKRGHLALFAEELCFALQHNIIKTNIELYDVSRHVHLNEGTGRLFYYFEDIFASQVVGSLNMRSESNDCSQVELALLNMFKSKTVRRSLTNNNL